MVVAKVKRYQEIKAELDAVTKTREAEMNEIAKELDGMFPKGQKQLNIGGVAMCLSHRGDSFFIKSPREGKVTVIA